MHEKNSDEYGNSYQVAKLRTLAMQFVLHGYKKVGKRVDIK